jgi:hypothetical protein
LNEYISYFEYSTKQNNEMLCGIERYTKKETALYLPIEDLQIRTHFALVFSIEAEGSILFFFSIGVYRSNMLFSWVTLHT